jgi:hypothetical protein
LDFIGIDCPGKLAVGAATGGLGYHQRYDQREDYSSQCNEGETASHLFE